MESRGGGSGLREGREGKGKMEGNGNWGWGEEGDPGRVRRGNGRKNSHDVKGLVEYSFAGLSGIAIKCRSCSSYNSGHQLWCPAVLGYSKDRTGSMTYEWNTRY